MANMGGWGILDYAVNFSAHPDDWLQLGYASYLCHWALMNAGTAENGYGSWFPGKENDGASGWTFNTSKWGRAWIRKEVPRGPWNYDGEIDLGYGSSTRMAATIVTRDSLFGWIAYGGTLNPAGRRLAVVPRDGLRNRFFAILPSNRVQLEFERDGLASENPVILTEDFSNIEFQVENRTGDSHLSRLTVRSTAGSDVSARSGNRSVKGIKTDEGWEFLLPITKETNPFLLTIRKF
jgi:hypothetical protein